MRQRCKNVNPSPSFGAARLEPSYEKNALSRAYRKQREELNPPRYPDLPDEPESALSNGGCDRCLLAVQGSPHAKPARGYQPCLLFGPGTIRFRVSVAQDGRMRKCKCGNDVASNAKACPKCRHRFTGAFGKLVAWIFAGVLGLMILAGIIGSLSDTPSAAPSSSAAAPVAARTVSSGPHVITVAPKSAAISIRFTIGELHADSF
jgi:hypothetical protein